MTPAGRSLVTNPCQLSTKACDSCHPSRQAQQGGERWMPQKAKPLTPALLSSGRGGGKAPGEHRWSMHHHRPCSTCLQTRKREFSLQCLQSLDTQRHKMGEKKKILKNSKEFSWRSTINCSKRLLKEINFLWEIHDFSSRCCPSPSNGLL